ALGLLAACDLAQDKVVDAISEAREAVDMHVTSGARPAEVRARCVLGHALACDGELAAADEQLRIALSIVDDLDLPATAVARRLLDVPIEHRVLANI
ncbi:MAG: hypothetical protein J2O49_04675, partial [Sciscionella sp.]|nr:hypothetical protein [Sciscionella sp.]